MLHSTWYKHDTSYAGPHNVRNGSYAMCHRLSVPFCSPVFQRSVFSSCYFVGVRLCGALAFSSPSCEDSNLCHKDTYGLACWFLRSNSQWTSCVWLSKAFDCVFIYLEYAFHLSVPGFGNLRHYFTLRRHLQNTPPVCTAETQNRKLVDHNVKLSKTFFLSLSSDYSLIFGCQLYLVCCLLWSWDLHGAFCTNLQGPVWSRHMVVYMYLHRRPTWRPENSVNLWLWLSRGLIICTEQTSIYISTFRNTLTSE